MNTTPTTTPDLDADAHTIGRIERGCYSSATLHETASISSILEDGAAYCIAYAEDGTAAGYAIVEFPRGGIYIADLAILPSYRLSRGVWGQLLGWLGSQIQGAKRVEADCRKSSSSVAIRLLKRHGFRVRTNVLRDYLVVGEDMLNVVAKR